MYEYFRFSVRISHEFCVFDLDQSFLFLFFFSVGISRNMRLQRPSGELRNILPTILEYIDISHDRFLNGKNGGRKNISALKKKVLSRKSSRKKCHLEVLR